MNLEIDENFDVIVVGAGLSGLMAAHTILEKDPSINLLLIEKTDKFGGHREENSVEFFSESNHYLKTLLEQLQMYETHVARRQVKGCSIGELADSWKFDMSTDEVPIYGSKSEQNALKRFLVNMEEIYRHVSFHLPSGTTNCTKLDEISMDDYLVKNLSSEKCRNFMRAMIETSCGISARKISALFYFVYCSGTLGIINQLTNGSHGMYSWILKGGSYGLCASILATDNFQIDYNERVRQIRNYKDCVMIYTRKSAYRCQHVVVCTSPKDVLKIQFLPELTESRVGFIERMTTGCFRTKIFHCNENSWKDKNLSGDVLSGINDEDHYIWRLINVSNREDTLYAIIKTPDGEKIAEQIKCYLGGQWYNEDDQYEPYIIYYPDIGDIKGMKEYRQPVNRVFWGGSETATMWYGRMEGSLQAGCRAGIELLYEYKPQCLNYKDIIQLVSHAPVQACFKEESSMTKFSDDLFNYTNLSYLLLVGLGFGGLYLILRRR